MRLIFLLLVIVISMFGSRPSFQQIKTIGEDWPNSETIDKPMEYIELFYSVDKYSKEYNIPPDVLYAIAKVESDYRWKLKHRSVRVSVQTKHNGRWRKKRTHAIGLCGVIYGANRFILDDLGISKKDLYVIRHNIHAAAAILRYKIDKTHSLKKGIRAYYGGGSRYLKKIAVARKMFKQARERKPKKRVPKKKSYYTVVDGDTIFSIARKTGIPIRRLSKMNKTNLLRHKLAVNEHIRINVRKVQKKHKVKNHKPMYYKRLLADAKQYLGVRYKWAGVSKKRGMDCSGFVQRTYKHALGVKLPRVSGDQYQYAIKHGKRVKPGHEKAGDLIFFRTRRRWIGHVAIVVDEKKKLMQHSSSGFHKNVISSYATRSYRRRLRAIVRLNKLKT